MSHLSLTEKETATYLPAIATENGNADPSAAWHTKDLVLIARAEALMRDRMATAPKVRDLAKALDVSRSTLERAFVRSGDSGVAGRYRHLKIEAAGELVAENRKLTSVAADTGFASVSAFTAAFRRLKGMSPADYRLHRAGLGGIAGTPGSRPHDRKRAYILTTRRARSTMLATLDRPLTIDALAHDAGVSKATLERAFRYVHGEGVATHAMRLRIDEARRLLRTGEKIAFVAGRVGFAWSSSFYRAFLRHEGCAPVDYAARHAPKTTR